ncbi:MAG TPA: hypothetical protein VFW23_08335 [Tepidisphaeraceae bacterium]|nr:hypothetical protein [Tepidisphaeraceae bacterium]
MRRLDVSAMFVSLWLLTSMMVDAVTPKELTVYMIAAATAPGLLIMAILYWRRAPNQDFAIVFAALWLITAIILELLSPQQLSFIAVAIAIIPPLVIGCVIYYLHWRRTKRRRAT